MQDFKQALENAKEYAYYKHEKITQEFLSNTTSAKDEGWCLAEIKTILRPNSMGNKQTEARADVF